MNDSITERFIGALIRRATPAIQREMRTLLEGQSAWDRVQQHAEMWVEIPAGLLEGSRWNPCDPLKIRPGDEPGCLRFNAGGETEVRFEDLRRVLAIAEERW